DLTRRTGRDTAVVDDAVRPVPLEFSYVLTPLTETLEELLATHQAPVYVVHFTQAAAVEQATSLLAAGPRGPLAGLTPDPAPGGPAGPASTPAGTSSCRPPSTSSRTSGRRPRPRPRTRP